jgi:hypothetical protein
VSTYEQLDEWRQDVLSGFTDHRIVDTLWMDVHVWFWQHLYGDLSEYDAVFRGVTIRQQEEYVLLVLKVFLAEVPHVVFISGSTTTSCMRKLRDKLRNNEVNFVVDKYA